MQFNFLLLLFSLLLPRSLSFFYKENPPRRIFSIICSRPAPWKISSPSWKLSWN